MGIEVLRPNETLLNTGTVTGGGGVLHTALSDNSDASYGEFDCGSDYYRVGMESTSISGSAEITAVQYIGRFSKLNGSDATVYHTMFTDDSDTMGYQWERHAVVGGTLNPQTVLVKTWTKEQTTTKIDALDLYGLASYDTSSGAKVRVYELYAWVYYCDPPVVSVDSPSGTLTTQNRPTVSWTNTLDWVGGDQVLAEVKIFDDATYLAGGFDPDKDTPDDSGTVQGAATSWRGGEALDDDTYRAYVKTYQWVNGAYFGGDWAYSEFTIDVDRPATATLTLNPTAASGRVRIQVGQGGTTPATTDGFQVERSIDDGATWTWVRCPPDDDAWITGGGGTIGHGYASKDAGGTTTIDDYEAPNGVSTVYRARAAHDYDGSPVFSEWVLGTTSWTDADAYWLKHPYDGATYNVEVTLRSQQSRTNASRRGAHSVLDRKNAVVVGDSVRGPVTGQIAFRFDSETAEDAFEDLIDTAEPVLLQAPSGAERLPDRWINLGDVTIERAVDTAWGETTFASGEWTEVDRPAGPLAA